ncbi:hypothetical protein JB92DRAFT_3107073 [Gautieria morchelliformis]|nr:hypothetical protein JB92DRAFT_3107073 [Gautieria morchelliformis]
MADLITFNTEHANLELIPPFYTSQSEFITSEATEVHASFFQPLAAADMGRTRNIDGTLQKFKLDALLLPTSFTSKPGAITGYPIVTVPLGFQPDSVVPTPANPAITTVPGIPYAFAYEQERHKRLKRLASPAAIPKTQLKDILGSNED